MKVNHRWIQQPGSEFCHHFTWRNGRMEEVRVRCWINTPIEIDYHRNGGILPYVFWQLASKE